jgi:hypothetical protein
MGGNSSKISLVVTVANEYNLDLERLEVNDISNVRSSARINDFLIKHLDSQPGMLSVLFKFVGDSDIQEPVIIPGGLLDFTSSYVPVKVTVSTDNDRFKFIQLETIYYLCNSFKNMLELNIKMPIAKPIDGACNLDKAERLTIVGYVPTFSTGNQTKEYINILPEHQPLVMLNPRFVSLRQLEIENTFLYYKGYGIRSLHKLKLSGCTLIDDTLDNLYNQFGRSSDIKPRNLFQR